MESPASTKGFRFTVREDPPVRHDVAYVARVVRVFARTEFKRKYAGSVLGYFWSLGKPLIYFAVLWIVFGHLFRTGIPDFGLYLIVGIVLFTYLSDAVTSTLTSIVARGAVLRRVAFPSIAIPLGSLASATITFLLNCLCVAIFVAVAGQRPAVRWLVLVPLILEFVLFVTGIALIASSLYVRFRDIGQIWEVIATVLLYSSAIMYPIGVLPSWFRGLVGFNPLVQVVQDARRALFVGDPRALSKIVLPHSSFYGVAVVFVLLAVGLILHRRESPRFAELA